MVIRMNIQVGTCCKRTLLYFPPTRESPTSEAQCGECGKKYSIPRRNWSGCEEFRAQEIINDDLVEAWLLKQQ